MSGEADEPDQELKGHTPVVADSPPNPKLAQGTRDVAVPKKRRTNTAHDGVEIVTMKPPVFVLAIVGDVEEYEAILDWVRRRGLAIDVANTGDDGLRQHATHGADLILLGLPLPDRGGAAMIANLRAQDPSATIVVVGTDADVRTSGAALELGAQEYVPDPVEGRRDLLFALGVSLGIRSSDPHVRMLRTREASRVEWRNIVATSPAMAQAVARVREICERSLSAVTPVVLFAGERGTGKHLLARALHYNGPRRYRLYAELHCASLSPDELRLRLFGQVHGAARPGLFESTHGGTLYLEDIETLPLDIQRELFAAIEDHQIRRVGGDDFIRADVQLVAGTRTSLEPLEKRGELHTGLYHRLSTRTISLPPLRARGADIISIADSLLAELAAEYGRRVPTLAFDAREAILQRTWPGNVRELRLELERAMLLVEETVLRADHFRFVRDAGAATVAMRAGKLELTLIGNYFPLDQLELEVLREALARTKGNVSRAARFLGITRQTLLYRLKKHNLRGPGAEPDDATDDEE